MRRPLSSDLAAVCQQVHLGILGSWVVFQGTEVEVRWVAALPTARVMAAWGWGSAQ